jgi:FlgN protein
LGHNSGSESRAVVGELISNLKSQFEIHGVLLEALKNEGSLPASCSLVELNEVHSVRDFAVRRIRELESSRLQLIVLYQKTSEIDESISLREIITRCDRDQQQQLLVLREKLIDVITQIKPEGRKNAEIAIARISCFNEIQGSIDKSLSRISTYSERGEVKKSKGSYLVRKSI